MLLPSLDFDVADALEALLLRLQHPAPRLIRDVYGLARRHHFAQLVALYLQQEGILRNRLRVGILGEFSYIFALVEYMCFNI